MLNTFYFAVMKGLLNTLACFLLLGLLAGCAEEEDIVPCFSARVVDSSSMCGQGDLVELTGVTDQEDGVVRCGFGEMTKLVRVVNLPDDLKYEGATFTCQLEEIEDPQICAAIYVHYTAARITNICSKDTAPVVAAGK